MNLRDLWETGKVTLVASCSNEISYIITCKENESKLDKVIKAEKKVEEYIHLEVEAEENNEFIRELFKKLIDKGINAKTIKYYTSRNYYRPKGEYRAKHYLRG